MDVHGLCNDIGPAQPRGISSGHIIAADEPCSQSNDCRVSRLAQLEARQITAALLAALYTCKQAFCRHFTPPTQLNSRRLLPLTT